MLDKNVVNFAKKSPPTHIRQNLRILRSECNFLKEISTFRELRTNNSSTSVLNNEEFVNLIKNDLKNRKHL